ncbi:Fc.00g054180.m01.CDS01 [Cosmosporella sp. VM-42]
MDDFPPSVTGHHRPEPRGGDEVSIDSDQASIYREPDNPNQIVTHAPSERFRLGYFDVMCLVMNRMIGTGIFNSPQQVMQGTQSTGASLLLWFAGIIYCLCGTHVYIEYGLNVPRYRINGVEQSVPRSGGDLNYLQYVYQKPAYRKNTVLLSTCLFGVGFIALGNMAGNSLSFAMRVMAAADVENPSNGSIRGIAIAIATATCFIHAASRRGGIWLNNVLAIIKVMILLLVIVTAIIVAAGGLKNSHNIISENTSTSNSFKGASTEANGYAQGFLAIIFSFSGFEQPNYVMGEISRPRRKHPVAMITGVSIVVLLYMAVNIAYMVVVPKEQQINGDGGVAQIFFEMTLGSVSPGNKTGIRVFNAFLAISSLGNIIVMTYTAARVKQEIAKEGIIPFAKFFAQNTDMSVGRLLAYFQKKGWFSSLLRIRWFSPEGHREQTPVGAFVLHFLSCLILIFATWEMTPNQAYTLLTKLGAYVTNAFFGTFLGLGILILRFRGPPATDDEDDLDKTEAPKTWRQLTGKHINPVLSVVCASIYMIGGLWPVVASWVGPSSHIPQTIKWYLVPAISWAVIGTGALWFLGFITIAWWTDRKHHKVFVVEKKPEFESADGFAATGEKEGRGSGGLVLVHETVYLSWVGRETLRARRPEEMGFQDDGLVDQQMQMQTRSPFAGTDFDGYFQGRQQHDAGYGTGYRP